MKNEIKIDVYDIVQEKILALLDKGEIPWRKPWHGAGSGLQLPSNYVTKKVYSGLNPFLLLCAGYDCPYWVSYKQAVELGGSVRKGEKGHMVVFWKPLPKTDKVTGKPILNNKGKPEMVFFLRYFTVFNLLQCDGIEWVRPAPIEKPQGWTAIGECESIINNMPNAPTISHGGNRACYFPALDLVKMPEKENFAQREGYYNTLFHELTHSTGHKSRLARKGVDGEAVAAFGSETYGKEELIAEMGAAFLCGFAGISPATLENSVAYLQNWKKAIKGDNKLVVFAASQAQKAADYIMGVKKGENDAAS